MKFRFSQKLSLPLIASFLWAAASLPGFGQTSPQIDDALESNGLVWTSTGAYPWTVGSNVRGRADVLTGGVDVPVLETTITGPAKLVFDWSVQAVQAALETPVLGLCVDGKELALDTPTIFWRCVELQIPNGTHQVKLRPLNGATIHLDKFIYDPGQIMGFVRAIGDEETGVWAVHDGSFAQVGAAARDGVSSAAQLSSKAGKRPIAYRLAGGGPTEAVSISFWQLQVANEHNLSSTPVLIVDSAGNSGVYGTWEPRELVTTGGRWLKIEGYFVEGLTRPGALYLDDFKVEVQTLSWLLDAPELTWESTAGAPDTLPWLPSNGSAPYAPLGMALASGDGPFEATISTTIQGPARFAATYAMQYESGNPELLLKMNGAAPITWPLAGWSRRMVEIPAGPKTLSLTAIEHSSSDAVVMLDQCNLLTPTAAPIRQALGTDATVGVWSSQRGGVTRDEVVKHSADASMLLTPTKGTVTEVVLDLTGPSVLSFWSKCAPAAELTAYGTSVTSSEVVAYWTGEVDSWQLRVFTIPSGPYQLHLLAQGDTVWLDDLLSMTAVPLTESLDATSDIPGLVDLPGATTNALSVQFQPGSGAVGDDALVFQSERVDELVIPFSSSYYPVRIRFRYLCRSFLQIWQGVPDYGLAGNLLFYEGSPAADTWREADIITTDATVAQLHFQASDCWLDNLRIESITPRPWADAAISTLTDPDRWNAFDKADRTGGICAASGSSGTTNGVPTVAALPMALPGAGGCDVSALWRRGRGGYNIFEFRCGSAVLTQNSATWIPVHAHVDAVTTNVNFSVTAASRGYYYGGYSYGALRGGEGLVDEVNLAPQPAQSFSQALDTNQPGSTIQVDGWNSLGTAIASVETGITFDGADSIAIRPDPTVAGLQKTTIRTSFTQGGFFHLRARRGGSGTTSCNVRWQANNRAGVNTISLSDSWTYTTGCAMSGTGATSILLEIEVDGDDASSVVYLDTFGWDAMPPISTLLEAPVFTNWVAGPEWVGGCYVMGNGTSVTALTELSLPPSQETSVSATATGPGMIVFNTGDWGATGTYTLRVAVDGVVNFSAARTPGYSSYYNTDQVYLLPGTHTVTWTIQASPGGPFGPFNLLSVALVPGSETALLNQRYPASEGWSYSEETMPVPLYALKEGVISPGGVNLPDTNCWLARQVTGPAEVSFGWFSDQSSYYYGEQGRLMVDDQVAGFMGQANTYYQPLVEDKSTNLSVNLPVGQHELKWSRALNSSAMAALGTFIVGPPVMSTEDIGGLTWVNYYGNEYRWKSVPGKAYSGLSAISARDTAQGECLVTGPGELKFMLSQDGRSIFGVGNQDSTYFYSSDAREWKPITLLVPPGPQRIRFSESYCEPTDGTEIAWVDDLQFSTSAFAQWRASKLSDPVWGTVDQEGDSDGDAVNDLFEFAFGTNPESASTPIGPASSVVGGQIHLQFPTLPYDATGLVYCVECSADLGEWVEMARVPANAANSAGPTVNLPAATRTFVRTKVLVE